MAAARKQQPRPEFSKHISSMCRFLDTARQDYTWSVEKVNEMEALTQDLLHKLELDGLMYDARAKLATQLALCRQNRRAHKDTVLILEPLIQYLDSEKGRQFLNLLREVLGKMRKVEERMETRIYFPRVLNTKTSGGTESE